MRKTKKILLYTLFAAYVLLMLWLLFGQRIQISADGFRTMSYAEELTKKINLIPFSTIAEFWAAMHHGSRSHAFINLAGNIIMFIPMGFFLPCLFRKADTFRRCMLYALLTVACIEILQLVTLLGSLDIDDLLLNMIGAAFGYGLYRISARLGKDT